VQDYVKLKVRGLILASLVAFSVGSIGHSVLAQGLGTAGDYNVFVENTDNQSNSDSEGGVAVGGNATLTNYGVNTDSVTGLPGNAGLVVGGNIHYTNGEVYYGSADVTGTTTFTDVSIDGGTPLTSSNVTKSLPPSFSFTTIDTALGSLSSSLATATTNGTITDSYNAITLTGTSTGINVFDLTGTQLASCNGLTIKAPSGSTVIVNVSGTGDQFENFQTTLNGVNNDDVLYNFYQATTLDVSGISVYGSLLAPEANVSFGSGNIDGTLVAYDLSGGGEEHNYVFDGSTAITGPQGGVLSLLVPEPTSTLPILFGTLSLAILLLRKRRIVNI